MRLQRQAPRCSSGSRSISSGFFIVFSRQTGARFTGTAGLPRATIQGGRSLNTLERAVTTAPSPIVTPGPTNTSAVIQTRSPMVMGAATSGIAAFEWSWLAVHKKLYWLMVECAPMRIDGHAVAIHTFAQASVVAHFQIPGRPDA
jgi:hypothetical protein